MKKAKFILKIDKNNRAKIYINKKWQKDVTNISIYGVPYSYLIQVEQFKRDKRGLLYSENNNIVRATKTYLL